MKWEPLFAQLLKLFIRTDKSKKEEGEAMTSVPDNGKVDIQEKDYAGRE